jgi:hypothetical protein
MDVDAGLQPGWIVPGACRRFTIELEKRREAVRLAADDGGWSSPVAHAPRSATRIDLQEGYLP